jgi:hypothetical protein
MVTRRKVHDYWTEVKRIVGGEVKQTSCCCAAPGATRKGCSVVAGNKTPCRCYCHKTTPDKPKEQK